MLKGMITPNNSKYGEGVEEADRKEYFNQIKRLPYTRHENTLLCIWNGELSKLCQVIALWIAKYKLMSKL